MPSFLEEILTEVLERINPTESEQKRIHNLSKKLTGKVEKTAKKIGIEVEVRVEGSVAKNTWLRDHPEIDIFMRVPTDTPKEDFRTVLLEVAKKATEGYEQVERFAEHPYLEAIMDNVYVNIVPCYNVKQGQWISATDRTPFHTDYVKSLLDEQLESEVRLLKRFMKGVEVYGAEIRVGGFSGYLCELLILKYDSFIKTLEAAQKWNERIVIDIKGHYKEKEAAKKYFDQPLIVVDPVDKGRNVAAAVRKKRLNEFIASSRAFLKNPDIKFFYPPDIEYLSRKQLMDKIERRGSTLVFVKFRGAKAVPDVLWGQLYKSKKMLYNKIVQHDFKILRDDVWSNEKNFNIFIFEIENRNLPKIKHHLGPPLHKNHDCEVFLKKHAGSKSTISGPRIEGGRWVVEVNRKYTDVVDLLKDKLSEKSMELVSNSVSNSIEILVEIDKVLNEYSAHPEFAKFLIEYLEGKPKWLN